MGKTAKRKKAETGRLKEKKPETAEIRTEEKSRLLGPAFGVLALDALGPKVRIIALAALKGGFGVARLALLADDDVQKRTVGYWKFTHKQIHLESKNGPNTAEPINA